THIVEQREPEYLRAEGTGEDTSVASSLKQTSEVFLTDTPEGGTELRIKVNVDLLGRLGTFGLSVMKTKADRMWDEFGKNLAERLEGRQEAAASPDAKAGEPTVAAPVQATDKHNPAPAAGNAGASPPESAAYDVSLPQPLAQSEPRGWLSRLLGGQRSVIGSTSSNAASVFRVEVRQLDRTVSVEWPVEAAGQCQE